MRLVILGLTLGLALPAAAGAQGIGMVVSQSPVSTQPLAPGEVLLEINAMGTVTTHADTATLTIPFDASGVTAADARRAAEGAADRIAAAAASSGVAASDISRRPITTGEAAAMAAAMADMARVARSGNARRGAMAVMPDASAPPQANAHGEIEITLRDLSRLPGLRRALEAAGAGAAADPTYALSDDRAARAEARAQALAQARASADAYAAALAMRIVRLVRVTERVGVDLVGAMFNDGGRMRQMMRGMEGRSQEIGITVALGMDFALAPR
jgi:uncharacterized protein YggE